MTISMIERIKELVTSGVLGPECLPEPYYWHWHVLKPDELPSEFTFKQDYEQYGEIRWYGSEG